LGAQALRRAKKEEGDGSRGEEERQADMGLHDGSLFQRWQLYKGPRILALKSAWWRRVE
jgi:hypothetical protein